MANYCFAILYQAFKKNRPALVDKIVACAANRFDDLQNDVMKGVNLLNFILWPVDSDAFDTFGDLEVSLLVNHFKPLLEKNEVALSAISTEWTAFKHYAAQNFQGNSNIWPLLLTHYRVNFQNFAHLIEILLLFPISNATVERGFSNMRRIKTDWRSQLNEETLDHLLRISIDGPPLPEFDPRPAVEQFFSTPRQPDTTPYGARKRRLESDTDSDTESE